MVFHVWDKFLEVKLLFQRVSVFILQGTSKLALMEILPSFTPTRMHKTLLFMQLP